MLCDTSDEIHWLFTHIYQRNPTDQSSSSSGEKPFHAKQEQSGVGRLQVSDDLHVQQLWLSSFMYNVPLLLKICQTAATTSSNVTGSEFTRRGAVLCFCMFSFFGTTWDGVPNDIVTMANEVRSIALPMI